jgi:hypothetical protein
MDDQYSIDQVLNRRRIPATPMGLSQRIIDAAASRPQPKDSFTDIPAWAAAAWQDFAGSFTIAHPALVMAAMLVIGVMTGLGAGKELPGTYNNDEDYSVVYLEEDFQLEEWL